jgi:hypothetical protein
MKSCGGAGTGQGFVQVAQLDNTTGLDVNDLYAQGQIICAEPFDVPGL